MINPQMLEREFWYHVSPQHEIPLAVKKEVLPLQDQLEYLCEKMHLHHDTFQLIKQEIYDNPQVIYQLRTLVSISDKRFYLDLSYMFSRYYINETETLCGCSPENLIRHQTTYFINILRRRDQRSLLAAEAIANYLFNNGLDRILKFYCQLPVNDRNVISESLILPKESQQQDAKLRGHGPEKLLAEMVRFLGCKFTPSDKDINPMGAHDPNIDPLTMQITPRDSLSTFSSDLVILDQFGNPTISVVGLIHTSDPGQFGVDKANTVKAIRSQIDYFNQLHSNRYMELWGLVDGVGYSENKNGTINAMLPYFSNFVQVKTLWKVALRLHSLNLCRVQGIMFDQNFYHNQDILEHMQGYVPKDVYIYDFEPQIYSTKYMAGTATLFFS